MSERDLFKAIVLSGAALVTVPGCGTSTPAPDAATTADAGNDAAVIADAGHDTNDLDLTDAADHDAADGFVAIL